MFMHASWLHIIGNMIFFWAFAPEIEGRWGAGVF
jgi:membrane associated rhomboid family serine protease